MINYKKHAPLYIKLFVSFTAVVIFITSSLGFSFFNYFTKNFNNKVEQVNMKMIENISSILQEKVFSLVEKLYVDIVVNNSDEFVFLFNNGISMNSAYVYNGYSTLKTLVDSNSKIIDSIFIFYRDENTVLSYPSGIRYLNGIHSDINQSYLRLFDEFINSKDNIIWSDAHIINDKPYLTNSQKKVISVIYSYPLNLSGEACKGFILMNINERAFFNIIKQTYPESSGYVFIVDSNNKLISHSTDVSSAKVLSSNLNEIVSRLDKSTNSMQHDIDGVKSIISYVPIHQNDWKLVNITSVEDFYKESYILKRTIVIICLSVLIMGIIISNIFSIRLHNPIKLFIINIMSMIDIKYNSSKNKSIEFVSINKALNEFSCKMHQLENTLISSRPVLKHNFVYDLFNKNVNEETELKNRLLLIGLDQPYKFFFLMLFSVSKISVSEQSITKNQFMKYNIIEFIESQNNNDLFSIAALLSNNTIGIFINSNSNNEHYILSFGQKISSYTYLQFNIRPFIIYGQEFVSIESLFHSIDTINKLHEYSFFLPDYDVVSEKVITSHLTEIFPNELMEPLNHVLKSHNLEAITSSVRVIITEAIKGEYSDNCLKNMINFLIDSLKKFTCENALCLSKYHSYNITNIHEMFGNILDFEKSYLMTLNKMLKDIADINKSKTCKIIEIAKTFIENNLDLQLSLDMVANRVNVSPTYLSKVFKEETDENFTDYVNKIRLIKARVLIISSNMKINDIAIKVGFNNTNYFIKKFKQEYGTTPKLYKLNEFSSRT